MNKTTKFLVREEANKLRLDKFLSSNIQTLTRSQIKKNILSKNVKINNDIVTSASKKIKSGDIIQISINEIKKDQIKPQKIKIRIVYEDKDLIIVNKPSGLIVHPGSGNKDGTLANALKYIYKKKLSNLNGMTRPGIVHRIDKETSGLLVIAKNNITHASLAKQFSDHTIRRKYIALIWGVIRPLEGKITTLIARSKKNRQLMSVSDRSGKKAITNYKTIKVYNLPDIPKISLIECALETGRTHQIRVHLSHIGNNLIGDKKYGKRRLKFRKINAKFEKFLLNFKRQALHAKSLGFFHPVKKTNVYFESDLPNDFKKIIDFLDKFTN